MIKDSILRSSILELNSLNHCEVVKVAGIVRNLQHFLKQILDPEYRSKVLKMDGDTKSAQEIMKALGDELEKIRWAIRTGNSSEYEQAFDASKILATKLWGNLRQVEKEAPVAAQVLPEIKQEIAKEEVKKELIENREPKKERHISPVGYSREERAAPGFNEKFKTHLPQEFDVELDKEHDIPLQEIKWFQTLAPEKIEIREGEGKNPLLMLSAQIKRQLSKLVKVKILSEEQYSICLSTENFSHTISNFKESIVRGNLIKATPRIHAPGMPDANWGLIQVIVQTAPFEIVPFSVIASAKAVLVDYRTVPHIKRDKTTLIATEDFKILDASKIANLKFNIFKSAFTQQTELKYQTLSDIQLAEALRSGYKKVFGEDPTAQVLAGGWAQASLESGRPVKLPNFNIGNIKTSAEWIKSGKPFFVKDTGEFDKDRKYYIEHGTKWRSYPTAEDGAVGYWSLIGRKYQDAMRLMAAEDPHGAAVSLGKAGYFTADIDKYAKGTSSLYNEFMTKIAPQLSNLKSIVAESPKNIQESKSIKQDESVEQTLETLLSMGPLEKLVKESMMPKTNFLILIEGADFQAKSVYAFKIGEILEKYIGASVKIHGNNDKIEIQGNTVGNSITVSSAIQEICDNLSEKIIEKNASVQGIVATGFFSRFSEVPAETIQSNSRRFNFAILKEKYASD